MIFIVLPCGLTGSDRGQGIKISTGVPGANRAAKSKEAGSTPTTFTGRLLKVNFLPTTDGSEANRLRQKPWLRITAGGATNLCWHSSAVNDLPNAGSTPSSGNRFSVTGTPVTRS